MIRHGFSKWRNRRSWEATPTFGRHLTSYQPSVLLLQGKADCLMWGRSYYLEPDPYDEKKIHWQPLKNVPAYTWFRCLKSVIQRWWSSFKGRRFFRGDFPTNGTFCPGVGMKPKQSLRMIARYPAWSKFLGAQGDEEILKKSWRIFSVEFGIFVKSSLRILQLKAVSLRALFTMNNWCHRHHFKMCHHFHPCVHPFCWPFVKRPGYWNLERWRWRSLQHHHGCFGWLCQREHQAPGWKALWGQRDHQVRRARQAVSISLVPPKKRLEPESFVWTEGAW